MRKLLLNPRVNHSPLFKKLRQLLVLTTLLFTLPQTAWGTDYNSGTLDTTNKTWGAWTLSDGPTYSKSSSDPQQAGYYYLEFSGASTITLTLTKPANTTDVIQGISIEIGDGVTTTTLLSATIGTTNIFSSFQLISGIYTYAPTNPAEWTGDIVITLQGENNQGGLMSAYVTTSPATYGLTIAGIPVTSTNKDNVFAGDQVNDGKVSFTPASTGNNNVNTLTLDGVSLNGSIVSELGNLTILIKGDNTVYRSDTAAVISSTNQAASLIFTKEGNATLEISNNSTQRWPLIWNFASIDYTTNGLSIISPMPIKYAEASINSFVAKGLIPAYKDPQSLNTVTFTTATVYPLWIAGTQVTEANKNNITSAPTSVATFTPADGSNKAKLSFGSATITGHIISGVGDLEIHFSGTNTITSTDSSAVIRPMENNDKLYFTADNNSSLILDHQIGASAYGMYSVIHSYNSIELGDGIYQETKAPSTYDNSSYSGLKNAANGSPLYYLKLSTSPTYPLWVAGTQATSTTLNGTGWTYDNDNKKLSLSGANLNGSIISGLGDLTIDIEGANTIAVSDTASVIRSTNGGKLTITKTGNNPSLVLNNTRDTQLSYHAPSIKDFASFELAEGLYLSNTRAYTYNNYETPAVYDTYINNYGGQTTMGLIDPTDMDKGSKGIRDVTFSTTVSYPIWVAGKQVTPANAGAIFSNVSFTPASSANENVNTLKFTGATLSDAIVTSLNNLTVEFSGDNVLGNAGGQYGFFHGSDPNAILTFKALTNDAKIELHAANSYAVVEGFGNVAFDKAVAEYTESFSYNTTSRRYINDNGDLQLLYIKSPTAPTMGYNDQEKVTLGKAYLDGDIYYDITYAEAGKTNETGVKYTAPFALEAPATVEAWVVANGATSTKAKGKHFGYEGAPFTMLANDTKTPVLIPAIETGDNITFNYSSSDDNIATFANGVITAKAFGNATLTTSMETTGTAILNDNTQIKTVVKVAKDITGISFSGNAQYSSYCNTDADDLTLPNGIKAYAVKIPTSGNEVVLSEIGFIPGTVNSQNPIYTPILLKRDDTSKTSFGTVTKYVRESGYTLPSNDLKFNTDTQTGKATDGRQYILYKDEFVKATGTITGPCCYLEVPSTNPNPARGFVIEGGNDGSTAIDALINEEETGNGEWYDLQGRRIQKPTKPGLYIVNGKKVVVNNK